MISTFSAINASIYGGSRVSYEIAEDDELPHELTSKLWNHPVGLLITSVATLILVNSLNLESISIAGSIGFLLVFAIVNLVAVKLHKKSGSTMIIPLIGFVSCISALAALIVQQYATNKTGILISTGIISACVIMEAGYKKVYSTTQDRQ